MKQIKAKDIKVGMTMYLQFDHEFKFPLPITKVTLVPKSAEVRSAHVALEVFGNQKQPLLSPNYLVTIKE